MSEVAIRVEGIGKRYRVGRRERYQTLRDRLTEAMYAPYRAVAAAFDDHRQPSKSKTAEPFIWALDNVSFEVEQGTVLGVIGPNGAGKSTLLKILSRITKPTTGSAEIRGRVGSLLEVGTGFHPELTGRENIYLNGAILGMKRTEIVRKFDEIVAFAEVDKFVDTPVKHYSSGMFVRLAFAVAAHLEPEILLVDEVLAVGDAAFQKKCLGKMEDVSRTGRTILFVSHNMSAIGQLCTKGLLLAQGCVKAFGDTPEVLSTYLSSVFVGEAQREFAEDFSKLAQIRLLRLLNHRGELTTDLDLQQPFVTEVVYDVKPDHGSLHVAWMMAAPDGTRVCESTDLDARAGGYWPHQPGRYVARVQFPGGLLNAGTYVIRVGLATRGGRALDHQYGFRITLHDHGSFVSGLGRGRLGVLLLKLPWEIVPVTTHLDDPLDQPTALPV